MNDLPPPPRLQRIAAVRRNGLYWLGGDAWSPELRLANLYPLEQAARKARIDIGLDGCELIEVEPIAVEGVEPLPVEKLEEKRTPGRWPVRLRKP